MRNMPLEHPAEAAAWGHRRMLSAMLALSAPRSSPNALNRSARRGTATLEKQRQDAEHPGAGDDPAARTEALASLRQAQTMVQRLWVSPDVAQPARPRRRPQTATISSPAATTATVHVATKPKQNNGHHSCNDGEDKRCMKFSKKKKNVTSNW